MYLYVNIKTVNVFALHWFLETVPYNTLQPDIISPHESIALALAHKLNISDISSVMELVEIDKIITTNSTNIVNIPNDDTLQVIDCKKIFEEFLDSIR